MKLFKKILIANRGEIAVRIIRSAKEMGIRTVAVYSKPDAEALHTLMADEAYFIGEQELSDSYLNVAKIIDIAKQSASDAIHPGYGFLAENPELVNACQKEGIVFIGPSLRAIQLMGNKVEARDFVTNLGTPMTKGAVGTHKELIEAAKNIPLPILVKAAAGGGGKGMRLVRREEDIISGVRAAKSEAMAGFGDDTVYVEKFVENPHHIEVQILGDSHGNAIHLFERECSVQRRHQKVLEETPSPLVTPELRAKMGKQAVMAAKAVDYVGAGTVEFLVDDDLNYYFLEMNTRLQVEHPITEEVTGVDLVKEQIRVADGLPLSYKQEDLSQNGHAIEVRIYAEDPDNNFMPSPGEIKYLNEPLGLGIRHDGYVYSGYKIPMEYDPMISKMIAWDTDRDAAIKRMRRALSQYKLTGIKTNIRFLARIMECEAFAKGKYNTQFIEENEDFLMEHTAASKEEEDIVIATAFLHHIDNMGSTPDNESSETENFKTTSAWKTYGKWRSVRRF